MTLRQWFTHFIQWLLSFPLPRHDDHLWIAEMGEREHTCPICKATWVDAEITDEQLARDKVDAAYDRVFKFDELVEQTKRRRNEALDQTET